MDGAASEPRRLELLLLEPSVRADRDALERLLHPDFAEHGASGRAWTRGEIIEALLAEPGEPAPGVEQLRAETVAPGVVLVTYTSVRDDRRARRSALWLATPEGWRLRFHQGTPVPAARR
jgi:hypothetical protein